MNTPTELEERTVAYHERTFAEDTAIWRDGINILLRGFDALQGRDVRNDTERVQVALLIRAWDTVYCAFDLALRGYYPQSLNLLRAPIEDWMAYWYLRSFPDDHSRFLGLGEDTPSFNDMLQQIEAKHGKEQGEAVRPWIKRLHKFSHVDRLGIKMAILPGADALNLALGPQQDRLRYLLCVEQGLTVTLELMEALDNLRRVMNAEPLEGFRQYVDRVDTWQQEQAKKARREATPDPDAKNEDTQAGSR